MPMPARLSHFARALALVSAVAMIPIGTAGLAQVDGRAGSEFSKLFAVYQRIKSSYVEEVDDEKLIRGAIDGMLASLDPHSAYLDGSAFQRITTMIDGEYQGLGLSVTMEENTVKVISPMKGSPAAEMGVKAGDYITHLDGKLIVGLDLDEAVAQMRGKAGSSIRLSIYRPGRDKPFDVTVKRGVIQLEPVTHELVDGGIGVVSINEFSADVGSDVYTSLEAMRREAGGKLKGIVLDLRSNPGGQLNEAVALSDLFMDHGLIVSQRGRLRGENARYDAETMFLGDVARGIPMVVLINAGSASASEIVAGALQDSGRAVVMGERSFGKGSVQSLMLLSQDSAVKLTTARYYTPSGRSVQEGGIEPDIRVPQLSDADAVLREQYGYRESDLRGHLVNDLGIADKDLEKDRTPDPRFTATAEELEKQGIEDFQLDYALKTLRRGTPAVRTARR